MASYNIAPVVLIASDLHPAVFTPPPPPLLPHSRFYSARSFTGSSMCSNGIPGVESSNGLACCPSGCDVCNVDCKSSRRLSGGGSSDSSDDNGSGCGGKRRLSIAGGGSASSDSGDLTDNYCGVLSRRRLTYYGGNGSGSESGSESNDSGDFEDYCDCDSGGSSRRRLRGLTWYGDSGSSDSGDSCNCGAGRRLTYYGGDPGDSGGSGDSGDDCNCECECECECVPEVPEEPSCCADDIIETGDPCDVTGAAPCYFCEYLTLDKAKGPCSGGTLIPPATQVIRIYASAGGGLPLRPVSFSRAHIASSYFQCLQTTKPQR